MKSAQSLLIICLFTFSLEALAVLGGELESVGRTQKSMAGSVRKASFKAASGTDRYTIEEVTASGVAIREFASPSGKIFAVSWRGVREPDLSVLLGKYFPEYESEIDKQVPSRARSIRVQTAEIVVRRAGHMRDKRGIAYVVELIPPGVNVGELE